MADLPELKRDIEWFFTAPSVEPARHQLPDRRMSTLYLLRRDALNCLTQRVDGRLLTEEEALAPQSYQRIFPSVMVITSGIDLLAKFHSGEDEGAVGTRFEAYLSACGNLTPDEAHALWLLRNAQVHSYGLYGFIDLPKRAGGGRFPYRFTLLEMLPDFHRGPKIAWQSPGSNTWVVCVATLYEMFITSVANYEQRLLARCDAIDDGLPKAFAKMFERYGYLGITEQ
jgi:hypothetical protein